MRVRFTKDPWKPDIANTAHYNQKIIYRWIEKKITHVMYKFRSKTLNFEDLSLHHASSQLIPNAVTCTKLVAVQQYCCLFLCTTFFTLTTRDFLPCRERATGA